MPKDPDLVPPAAASDLHLMVCGASSEAGEALSTQLRREVLSLPDGSPDGAPRLLVVELRHIDAIDATDLEACVSRLLDGARAPDAALLALEAGQGWHARTRRQLLLLHLLGVRHVMVLVALTEQEGGTAAAFERVVEGLGAFAGRMPASAGSAVPGLSFVPAVGAPRAEPGPRPAWHVGPTLAGWLAALPSAGGQAAGLQAASGAGSGEGDAGVADQFDGTLLWLDDEPLLPGRRYLMRRAGATVPAAVSSIRHRVDVDTLERMAARRLERGAIGVCQMSLEPPSFRTARSLLLLRVPGSA